MLCMDSRTSIQLHYQTQSRLREVGKFGETYDSLINRLLDERQNREQNTCNELVSTSQLAQPAKQTPARRS